MKPLDRLLQRWRMEKLRGHLRPGDRVLDIGSADGALFRTFPWLGGGVALDPEPWPVRLPAQVRHVAGQFPEVLESEPDAFQEGFDAVVLLAVLEHIPLDAQQAFAEGCRQVLRPGGLALMTVPGPAVDQILDVLMAARIVDGMEVGQHYGYEPEQTSPLFRGAGFAQLTHRRFQLGLNHFFAFKAV